MVDPTKAVIVGLLDSADPETLAEIARAIGGSSHIARTPDEIVRVSAEAIAQCGGA